MGNLSPSGPVLLRKMGWKKLCVGGVGWWRIGISGWTHQFDAQSGGKGNPSVRVGLDADVRLDGLVDEARRVGGGAGPVRCGLFSVINQAKPAHRAPSSQKQPMHARGEHAPELQHLALEVLHQLAPNGQLLRPVICQVRAHARKPGVALLGVPVCMCVSGLGIVALWTGACGESINRAHRHANR